MPLDNLKQNLDCVKLCFFKSFTSKSLSLNPMLLKLPAGSCDFVFLQKDRALVKAGTEHK